MSASNRAVEPEASRMRFPRTEFDIAQVCSMLILCSFARLFRSANPLLYGRS